jgi:hypothetical protein
MLKQVVGIVTIGVQRVKRSQDSPIGIVTGFGLDGQGSIPDRGKRFFSTT